MHHTYAPSDPVLHAQEDVRTCPHHARMLLLSDVTKMRGDRCVLDHVTFAGHQGECIVVCGPSGSGKTTLLRAIAGLDQIDYGSVSVADRLLNSPAGAILKRGEVGMVFQGEQLYTHLTLLDNITLGPLKVLKQSSVVARQRAMGLLDAVGLGGKDARYPRELSGGERQRGAIARALAMSPKLILFDEPTSALDPSSVKEVLSLIYQLREQEQTMILVTHETAFARMIADRIICMDAGKIKEIGAPHKIIVAPEHDVTKQLFGDVLQEISALDRVMFTRTINVGYFACSDTGFPQNLPFLASLADHFSSVIKLRPLRLQNPLLQLRMGVADIIVSPSPIDDDLGRLHATVCEAGGTLFQIYVSAADSVWERAIAAQLAGARVPTNTQQGLPE